MPKVQLVSAEESFEVRIEDSYFTLCRIPAEETARMLRRHTKRRPGGQDEVDSLSFNREYRDRAIRAWRDVAGDPPCNAETKMLLPNDVWQRIQEEIGAANIEALVEKETSLKN